MDDRGQSNALAVGLVVSLALTTALLLAGIGATTLSQSKQLAEVEESVNALSELDSSVSLVALGSGDAATVDLGLQGGDGETRVTDEGQFRLVLHEPDGTPVELTNTTLGTVEYANGDHRVAYQGGGVWRRHAGTNESVMISPPQVEYQDGTLTLPMILVTGTENNLDRARVTRTDTRRVFPAGGVGTNPIPAGSSLKLFVTSAYYAGWADYFEHRIGANVTEFPANETVKVELIAHRSSFELADGLVSVGSGSPIDMQGSGADPTFVDSYDSAAGPYSASQSGNGTVLSDSGLNLGGTSYIDGNVNTGGSINLQGNSKIYGNARHQGLTLRGDNSSVTGWEAKNGTGPTIAPIDRLVEQKIDTICSQAPARSGITGSETLDAGNYCLDGGIDLDKDETLTLNLSDGDINLSVQGDILLNKGTIQVTDRDDNNTVNIWFGGSQIDLTNSNVTVPDDDSTALTVYGKSHTAIDMGGAGNDGSTFVGLIFAPAGSEGGSLRMNSQSELFGSAVTGLVDLQGGSAVHYDQALEGFSVDRSAALAASDLSYLHVSVNEVRIRPA